MSVNNNVPKLASAISCFFNYPNVLIGKFTNVFQPFERTILTMFLGKLDKHKREVLESQLSEINYIQYVKGLKSSELNFYKLSPFKIIKSRRRKFTGNSDVFELCRLNFFIGKNTKKEQFSRLYVVNGNFFSLECNFLISLLRNRTDFYENN